MQHLVSGRLTPPAIADEVLAAFSAHKIGGNKQTFVDLAFC